jgi:hypothetical protein
MGIPGRRSVLQGVSGQLGDCHGDVSGALWGLAAPPGRWRRWRGYGGQIHRGGRPPGRRGGCCIRPPLAKAMEDFRIHQPPAEYRSSARDFGRLTNLARFSGRNDISPKETKLPAVQNTDLRCRDNAAATALEPPELRMGMRERSVVESYPVGSAEACTP